MFNIIAVIFVLLGIVTSSSQAAFISHKSSVIPHTASKRSLSQTHSRFIGTQFVRIKPSRINRSRRGKGSELGMFLGSDGGILGVGAPEIAVILLVGYFVLGPSDLYRLTKDIGKFVNNLRTLGNEASKTFEDSMENQLELEELRKAQTELNNAFNFRRNININDTAEPFPDSPPLVTDRDNDAKDADTGPKENETTTKNRKRKRRRRVKKKAPVSAEEGTSEEIGEIPDLEMPGISSDEDVGDLFDTDSSTEDEDFDARIRAERLDRLQNGAPPTPPDWFSDTAAESIETAQATLDEIVKEEKNEVVPSTPEEQTRFASQLSGDWNEQILANEDKLSPLAMVMDRLAILEKERDAATVRLEEEFKQRAELDEEFYRKKRTVLEETAAEISMKAYGVNSVGDEED